MAEKTYRNGHKNLRKYRASLPNAFYFITVVTAERNPLFSDFDIACSLSRIIGSQKYWSDSKLLAWVVMPDHWHALIQLGEADSLSRLVQNINAVSARVINRLNRTKGTVWQGAYYEHRIRSDEDVVCKARYLISNPIRAGIAEGIADYSFWNSVWVETTDFNPYY